MPITRDFILQRDDDTGVIGLIPTWIGDASPTQSIAHDMLEHRKKEVGLPVTAELQAIGALLALRIENGAFYASAHSDSEMLALLVFEMLQDLLHGKELDRAPRTRPLNRLCDWAERLIQAAVPRAFELLRQEQDDPVAVAELGAIYRRFQADIVSWLRIGYRHAVRRYGNLDRYYVANKLFTRLDSASERLVNSEALEEGTPVRVSVCPRKGLINFSAYGQQLFI